MANQFSREVVVKLPEGRELTRAQLRANQMKMISDFTLDDRRQRGKYLVAIPIDMKIEMAAEKLGCDVRDIEEIKSLEEGSGFKKVG